MTGLRTKPAEERLSDVLRRVHEIAQHDVSSTPAYVLRDELLALLADERVTFCTYTLKQVKEMGWTPPGKSAEQRIALSKPEQRIATWCDCGKPVAGFAGTVIRCECGLLWSVARMLVGDVRGVQA